MPLLAGSNPASSVFKQMGSVRLDGSLVDENEGIPTAEMEEEEVF